MHAPKSVNVRPLRYKTHLCNNVQAVSYFSSTLLGSLEKYIAALEQQVSSQPALSKLVSTTLNLPCEVPQELHQESSLRSILEKLRGLPTQSRMEAYSTRLQESLEKIKPYRTKLQTIGKKLLSERQKLEKKKELSINEVLKQKSKYWEKAARASDLEGDPKKETKTKEAVKEMKQSALVYVQSVNSFAAFIPQYNEEYGALLDATEANDRCVMATIQQSVGEWLNASEQLYRDLLKDILELKEAMPMLWTGRDFDGYVVRTRKDPDPDPSQIYRFQLYNKGATDNTSPQRKRAETMKNPLTSLLIKTSAPATTESEEPPPSLEVGFHRWLSSLCLRHTNHHQDETKMYKYLGDHSGRMALPRALKTYSDGYNGHVSMANTAFDELYMCLSKSLDNCNDENDILAAYCTLITSKSYNTTDNDSFESSHFEESSPTFENDQYFSSINYDNLEVTISPKEDSLPRCKTSPCIPTNSVPRSNLQITVPLSPKSKRDSMYRKALTSDSSANSKEHFNEINIPSGPSSAPPSPSPGKSQVRFGEVEVFDKCKSPTGSPRVKPAAHLPVLSLKDKVKPQRNLASELRDHPYLLEIALWQEAFAVQLQQIDPLTLSPEEWKQLVLKIQDDSSRYDTAIVLGSLKDFLESLILIGIDHRLLRNLLTSVATQFSFTEEQKITLQVSIFPE